VPCRAFNIKGKEIKMSDDIELIKRLNKDLREASKNLSPEEARFMVDAFYTIQENRKRAHNQTTALSKAGSPSHVLSWFEDQNQTLENQLKVSLDVYANNHPVGQWALSQVGIGPIISAGLLAFIDVTIANTAGKVWRFAGLDPTCKWNSADGARGIVAAFRQANPDDDWKALMGICGAVCLKPSQVLRLAKYDVMAPTVEKAKEILAARGLEPDPSIEFEGDNILTHVEDPSVVVKDAYEWVLEDKPIKWTAVSKGISMRPWNTGLKVLCWKIGECFVYVSGKEDAYYGEVYSKRKKFETARNEGGYNATAAAEILKSKRIGEDTVAFEYYSKGKFPPAHVHARAKRYAVKLFLSHFHHVAYKEKFKKDPPLPYPISHLGHVDFIPPPPGVDKEARAA
jgi:hypothetical protein